MENKLNELKSLENKVGSVMFRMALNLLFINGSDKISKITDEEINKYKGNDFMTDEFVQDITRTSRELSKYNLFKDLIPYIKENIDVFGCTDHKEKANRYLTIAYNAICLGKLDELFNRQTLIDELGCTEEEYDEIMEE